MNRFCKYKATLCKMNYISNHKRFLFLRFQHGWYQPMGQYIPGCTFCSYRICLQHWSYQRKCSYQVSLYFYFPFLVFFDFLLFIALLIFILIILLIWLLSFTFYYNRLFSFLEGCALILHAVHFDETIIFFTIQLMRSVHGLYV